MRRPRASASIGSKTTRAIRAVQQFAGDKDGPKSTARVGRSRSPVTCSRWKARTLRPSYAPAVRRDQPRAAATISPRAIGLPHPLQREAARSKCILQYGRMRSGGASWGLPDPVTVSFQAGAGPFAQIASRRRLAGGGDGSAQLRQSACARPAPIKRWPSSPPSRGQGSPEAAWPENISCHSR